MPPHTTHWTNLFQPTKTYVAKGLPMTQHLTQQQIAEMKTNTLNGCETDHFKTDETILSLIATLEARDAAFDEMLKTLKDIARQKTTYEYTDGGDDFQGGYDACIQVARAAIAYVEKVK